MNLKPCPSCESTDLTLLPRRSYVACRNKDCCLFGPINDPDGSKWNALPRRITADLYPAMHPGCTDGACLFRDNSKGMATNGGCNCERDLTRGNPTGREAGRLIRYLRAKLKEVQTNDQ